jgi:toxin ParE1/3/4
MAQVIWTERAVAQLDAIADYIALDKPVAAQSVVRKIYSKAGLLAISPMLGRPAGELPGKHYRKFWVSPCWIYYRYTSELVIIIHIRRGERPFRSEDIGVA